MIAWRILCSLREDWRRRAGDSDETPPIDLLLLYCVRRPTVFSHKPKEINVQLCTISEQNFSEHVLLFNNSPTGMQFLISPPAQLRHRRTLVTHRRSRPRWAAARVCFPPRCCKHQRHPPRCQTIAAKVMTTGVCSRQREANSQSS